MSIIKLKGLVLREAYSGESDKIITVLTKERGKKTIVAKGARRPRSPFLGGTQQFCYSEFIVYDNKNIANLNQVEIIETFHKIRDNLLKLSYATYFMELLENSTMEEIVAEELLILTLKTFQMLNKDLYNPKFISRIYEIRLMEIIGYMPETTQCVNCGKELNTNIYFSSNGGGVLCNDCKKTDNRAVKISVGTLYSIQYILSSDLSKLFNFSVSELVLDELTTITKDYIFVHIEHKFKVLKFLEQL